MMTLPIGNSKTCIRLQEQGGFSLIEVVLCVVLLSVGLIAINQTLLKSLSTLSYIEHRYEADRIAQNQIWEIQNQAWYEKKSPLPRDKGVLLGSSKTFSYDLRSAQLSAFLYEVRLTVEWPESGKNKGLTRAFYASLPPLPKS